MVFNTIKDFLSASSQAAALKEKCGDIVFYAEGTHDWPFIGPLIQSLAEKTKHKLTYLTSDRHDPFLQKKTSQCKSYYIGSGAVRDNVLRHIDTKIIVMTLADLDNMRIKRSVHPVHYVYLFHSLNSTHMVYRKGSFDAYDTIFCPTPYHIREIRAHEEQNHLQKKNLVEYGYPLLENLMNKAAQHKNLTDVQQVSPKILIAPSWGVGSLVDENHIDEIVSTLLNANFEVILRLHPMSLRHHQKRIQQWENDFGKMGRFEVDRDISSNDAFFTADILLSDWSGAAYEFAYVRERPVIYIDTPPKVHNPDWQSLNIRPFEMAARNTLGQSLAPQDIKNLPETIADLLEQRSSFREEISTLRERNVFNMGKSVEVGLKAILDIYRTIEESNS